MRARVCVCVCRHVPAAGQDAQAGVRVGVSVRRRRRLVHLRRVGVARTRPRLHAVARLAGNDRLNVNTCMLQKVLNRKH